MSMRVTEGMKFNSSLYNLYNLQSASKMIIEQMSSQKKINRPSDDPTGIGKVLNIQNVQQMNDQYQKNIDNADSWLKMSEAKLTDLSDLLVNARELAVAQATGTATAETRSAAAANVGQLTEQMFGIANSQYMDRYIFAGARADQPPLSRDAFQGSATDLRMAMASGMSNGFSGTASMAIRSIQLSRVMAGDSLTIEGSVYTGVEGGANPAAGQFNIGATDAETANNLRTAIAAVNPGVYTLGGAGTADVAVTRTDAAELGAVSTNDRAHFSSYTGDANKTYAMKIITGGSLAAATYAISLDGGRTWGAEKTDLDAGVVDMGNGVVMRFTPGTFVANDIFSVRAWTPGFYDGDGEEAVTDIGEGSPFAYGISGDAIFTDKKAGQVDVFEVMKNLKTAMENNDQQGIKNQIDKLKAASDQVQVNITISGSRQNSMEVARNYQEDYKTRAADMLSKVEDVDIAKLTTDMATTQLALEASYKVTAAMMQGTTILNFLNATR
jgi:flagellar hook-associated protein 3 FlgL